MLNEEIEMKEDIKLTSTGWGYMRMINLQGRKVELCCILVSEILCCFMFVPSHDSAFGSPRETKKMKQYKEPWVSTRSYGVLTDYIEFYWFW